MDPLWKIAFVPFALAAFLAWFWWRSRVRVGRVRALADAFGFNYLGNALPCSLDLTGSQLRPVNCVWNVIDGEPRGKRIIAFDCKIGEGRGSFRRTVLAVKTQADISEISRFDSGLRQEQVNGWVLIYRPEAYSLLDMGLTPVGEVQAYLEAIGK